MDLAFLFDNKIALIGEVAEVAHDEFETPVGNVYGVEIIANTINTILNSGTLEAASFYLEALVLMCLAAFFAEPITAESFSRNSINILIISAHVIFCTILYVYFGLILSMSYALISFALRYHCNQRKILPLRNGSKNHDSGYVRPVSFAQGRRRIGG